MRAALFLFLLLLGGVAAADDVRALTPLQPVSIVEATVEPGPRLRSKTFASLAAPHRMIAVGAELWLALDAGIARVRADGSGAPRWIAGSEGDALGAVVDLVRTNDVVWASSDRGLWRIDAHTGRARLAALTAHRAISAIPSAWAITEQGVQRLPESSKVPAPQHRDATELLRCGSGNYLRAGGRVLRLDVDGEQALALDAAATALGCLEGELVVGTDDGVYAMGEEGPRALVRGHLVTTLAVDDARKELAFGTLADGAFVIAHDGATRRLDVVGEGRVWAIERAHDGWAVAADEVLFDVTDRGHVARRALVGPRGFVTALDIDGSTTWVGTFDDGLYRLEEGTYARVALPESRITALYHDDAQLFVGTAAGLFRLRRDGSVLAAPAPPYDHHISLLRHLGDALWVASYPGATTYGAQQRLAGEGDDKGATRIFGTTVFGMAERDGALWLATQDGAERVAAGESAVLHTAGGVLEDDWVNDVATCDGEVEVLTAQGGLLRMGPSGTAVERAHLPSSTGSLRVVGDSVVFAALRGLVVAPCHASGRYVRYATRAGVGVIVTALGWDAAHDRLWVGGAGGVLIIDDATAQLARGPSGSARR